MHEELTTATEALTTAQRALADAVQRVGDTESGIAAEHAKVAAAQLAFAQALEDGQDGAKQQTAWAKARAALTSLQERKEHLGAAVGRRELDVARGQRGVALAEQRQFAAKAQEIGEHVWQKLLDLSADFHELEGLDRANHAAAWSITHADQQLSEQTPLGPTIVFTTGLGEPVWALLREVCSATLEQRRRRELAIPAMTVN
jgi:hypothetical protein